MGVKDLLATRRWKKAEHAVNKNVSVLKSLKLGYSLSDGLTGNIKNLSRKGFKRAEKAASVLNSYGAGYYPTAKTKYDANSFKGVTNFYAPLKMVDYSARQQETKKLHNESIYAGAGSEFLARMCYDTKIQAKPNRRRLGLDIEEAYELKSNIESEFKIQRESKDWDYSKQNNFSQIADIAFRQYNDLGEFFGIVRQDLKRESGVSVQLISAFQISTPNFSPLCRINVYNMLNGCNELVIASNYGSKFLLNGNYIENGIEYSATGEEVAIFVAPTQYGSEWTRIMCYNSKGMKQVMHGFIQAEPGQKRGFSKSVRSWHEFMNISDLERFELASAKINATIAGTVTSDSNAQPGGNTPMDDLGKASGPSSSADWSLINPDAEVTSSLPEYIEPNYSVREVDEGGFIVQNFTPGYKYQSNDTSRPNVNAPVFMEKILEFAYPATYGISVVCAKMRFDGSYNASKGAIDITWKNGIQYNLKNFKSDFFDPCFSAWFETSVAKGYITAPDYYNNRMAYEFYDVVMPIKPSLNPYQEAKASEVNVAIGKTTRSLEAQASTGTDAQENMEQLKHENQAMKSANDELIPDPVEVVTTGGTNE